MISKRMAQQAQWDTLAQNGVRYCFVITHEQAEDADGLERCTPPYDYGPRHATDAEQELASAGRRWQVLDDDDNVCAQGRMWASDSPDDWTDSDAAFAPLNDYGEGMFGATTLQYRKAGEWVTL